MTSLRLSKSQWRTLLTFIISLSAIILAGCETPMALKYQANRSNNHAPPPSHAQPLTRSKLTPFAIPHPLNASQALSFLIRHPQITEHHVRIFLEQADQQHQLTAEFSELFHHYPEMSAYLLSQYRQRTPPGRAIHLGKQYHFPAKPMLKLTFLAYPHHKLLLAKNLIYARSVKGADVVAIAIAQGVNPSTILPYAADNHDQYRITPLIESASITLYHHADGDTASVQYKPVSESTWHQAMELQWEPVDETLTGSIVYLTAGTRYDVKITVTTTHHITTSTRYTFTTWNDKPPINPHKIYKLSDIYSGSGQLDLVALGISGSASGWAEIIGDDNTPIIDNSDAGWAVNIGANAYIYFKNITIKGGRKHGFRSSQAHHLWFDNVDVSGWGRIADYMVKGVGYDATTDQAINYDSAFALNETGVVVVENSTVHDPRIRANSWTTGHPYGPNAFLAWSHHPAAEYSGQVVMRNNHFYGRNHHRFNDVIESYDNGEVFGGFVRDTAIYNNTFAYSNDDIIELDGGQNNVLFYNNELSHAYCGVSVVPNMKGPSFIFNNYIHDLTDDDGHAWASIKAGGLRSRPEGTVHIYYNYIKDNTNGIAAAGYDGDYSYRVIAKNNVMIHNAYWDIHGYSIYDKSPSGESIFTNNYMFNLKAGRPVYDANITKPFFNEALITPEIAQTMWHAAKSYVTLPLTEDAHIPNLTQPDESGKVIIGYKSKRANQ